MIINYLEELLEEKEKNLHWLAKETGISYSSIHRFANNPILPVSTKTVDRVVIALGCEIQELLKVIRPQEYLESTREQVRLSEENIQLLIKVFDQYSLQVKAQDLTHYGRGERHQFMGQSQDHAVEFGFVLRLYFDYEETAWVLTTEEFGVDPQTKPDHTIYLMDQYLKATNAYCEAQGIRRILISRLPDHAQSIQKAMEGILTQAGFEVQTDKATRQTYWENFAEIQWKKALRKDFEMEGMNGTNQQNQ